MGTRVLPQKMVGPGRFNQKKKPVKWKCDSFGQINEGGYSRLCVFALKNGNKSNRQTRTEGEKIRMGRRGGKRRIDGTREGDTTTWGDQHTLWVL